MEKVYQVKGQTKFVKFLDEFAGKILTTAGLYSPEELEETDDVILDITYDGLHFNELPENWQYLMFLDDRNVRQHVTGIKYRGDDYPVFVMVDGYESEEVTG